MGSLVRRAVIGAAIASLVASGAAAAAETRVEVQGSERFQACGQTSDAYPLVVEGGDEPAWSDPEPGDTFTTLQLCVSGRIERVAGVELPRQPDRAMRRVRECTWVERTDEYGTYLETECELTVDEHADVPAGSVQRSGETFTVRGDDLAGCDADFTVVWWSWPGPPPYPWPDDDGRLLPVGSYSEASGRWGGGSFNGSACAGALTTDTAWGSASSSTSSRGIEASTP